MLNLIEIAAEESMNAETEVEQKGGEKSLEHMCPLDSVRSIEKRSKGGEDQEMQCVRLDGSWELTKLLVAQKKKTKKKKRMRNRSVQFKNLRRISFPCYDLALLALVLQIDFYSH